jgi:hypothetical protein
MVNGAFKFSSGTDDLGLERYDACVEFFHRERIEVLATERGDGIVAALGKDFLAIHGHSVDPNGSAVNNAARQCSERGNMWRNCPI